MKKLSLFGLLVLALFGSLTVSADDVVLDDLIVNGSSCVGFDCVNGEAFGFDTIRLKENNVRIHFLDTSTSAAFPKNDWMLVANDSNNGGQDRFSVEDVTGSRVPFTLRAGAPDHALYVAAAGVGLGTDTPARALHVTGSDTPTTRLEQTSAAGWPSYTWDVGGNESSFFVRDSTASTLPLRILPGASSDSLVLGGGGQLGVGTSNPLATVHVAADGAVTHVHEDRAASSLWEESFGPDPVVGGGRAWTLTEVGGATAIRVTHDGNVDIAGTLSMGSSRAIKQGFIDVNVDEVLEKVSQLDLSRWQYRSDVTGSEHLGPMAEDFHDAFGLGRDNKHLAPTDLAGVAVASVQALRQRVLSQQEEIARLKAQNAQREARLQRLEALLSVR